MFKFAEFMKDFNEMNLTKEDLAKVLAEGPIMDELEWFQIIAGTIIEVLYTDGHLSVDLANFLCDVVDDIATMEDLKILMNIFGYKKTIWSWVKK